eukprot:3938780-Rhodomonas_salina.1
MRFLAFQFGLYSGSEPTHPLVVFIGRQSGKRFHPALFLANMLDSAANCALCTSTVLFLLENMCLLDVKAGSVGNACVG